MIDPSNRAKPPKMTSLFRSLREPHEDVAWLNELAMGTDRSAALIVVAELDITLEQAITVRLRSPINAEEANDLFGDGGPLNAFGAKIRMGYALDLYGPHTKNDMITISKVRNAFAHSAKPLSFAHSLIADNVLCVPILRYLEEEAFKTIDIPTGASEEKIARLIKLRFLLIVSRLREFLTAGQITYLRTKNELQKMEIALNKRVVSTDKLNAVALQSPKLP